MPNWPAHYYQATIEMLALKTTKIGIIGLGYVGLPLAVEFGKQYPTIGLDLEEERIQELASGVEYPGSNG